MAIQRKLLWRKPFGRAFLLLRLVLAWYAARRLRSRDDMLNDNDARRGIVPPLERRARERARSVR